MEDILETMKQIERYANQLNNMGYLTLLSRDVINKKNDSSDIRAMYATLTSLSQLVNQQCKRWMEESNVL